MYQYDMNNVKSYCNDMVKLSQVLDTENFLEDTLFNEVYRKGSYYYDEQLAQNHFRDKPYSKMMIEDPRYLDFVNYRRINLYRLQK